MAQNDTQPPAQATALDTWRGIRANAHQLNGVMMYRASDVDAALASERASHQAEVYVIRTQLLDVAAELNRVEAPIDVGAGSLSLCGRISELVNRWAMEQGNHGPK